MLELENSAHNSPPAMHVDYWQYRNYTMCNFKKNCNAHTAIIKTRIPSFPYSLLNPCNCIHHSHHVVDAW